MNRISGKSNKNTLLTPYVIALLTYFLSELPEILLEFWKNEERFSVKKVKFL